MDGYQVDEAPFYTGPNGLVLAFRGLSKDNSNRLITVVSHLLLRTTYRTQFPQVIDAVLNKGLEKARVGGNFCKIVEMQVDLSAAPEKYTVFHVMDTTADLAEERKEGQETSGETELRRYIEEAVELMARKPSGVAEVVKRVSHEGVPIIVKQHRFSVFRDNDRMQNELAKAINSAIVQAQVEHPNACKVLEMHLDVSKAPKQYYLSHILEALDRNLGKEIAQRREEQRLVSDGELWDFLRQVAGALAYAHSKVSYT